MLLTTMKYPCLILAVVLALLVTICECDDKRKVKEKKKHGLKRIHGYFHKRQNEVNPNVNITNGQVIGKKNKTAAGTEYSSFQGIPFARPPIGPLRFEPPVPIGNWTSSYNATYERPICMQFGPEIGQQSGNEDCLYINVYIPNLQTADLKPVMFWIYGGGFIGGDGNFATRNPEYFLDQGLVVVTFNYRLGVFGFLSTGDDIVPGNMGIKDQILALKWVRDNIKAFGGNPQLVTIMGESAGAVSVSYLLQSPGTKGLYSAAIMESGVTLCPWAYTRTGRENALLLGKLYGVWDDNSTAIVQKLKNGNAAELFGRSVFTMGVILAKDPLNGLVYGPVSEINSSTPAFSGKAYEQLSQCQINNVPVLVGFNSAELNSTDVAVQLIKVYASLYTFIPAALVPKDMNVEKKSNADTVGKLIRDYYIKNGSLTISNADFQRYLSDDQFVKPTVKYFKLHSQCSKTYAYRFSYNGGQNKEGAGHAEELNYLFSSGLLRSGIDGVVSKNMVGLWSNFMKFRDPTPRQSQFNDTWIPASQSNDYSYMNIDSDLKLVNQSNSPFKAVVDFWDNLYNKYGSRPYDTYKR